jgi:hypothetical protein
VIKVFSVSAPLAHLATIAGVIVAISVAFCALFTYRRNNSIRKWELIKRTYDSFLEIEWYDFYKRIKNGDQIDFDNKDDEKLLNRSLTLFDALNYFRTQKLLDKKAWEYVACEVLNFALNISVWEYMHKIWTFHRQKKGFQEDIIPFTGFPDLFANVPKKFKGMTPPEFERRFNSLSREKQEFYRGKVLKYITPEQFGHKQLAACEQLQRAVAISMFAKAEGMISE